MDSINYFILFLIMHPGAIFFSLLILAIGILCCGVAVEMLVEKMAGKKQ